MKTKARPQATAHKKPENKNLEGSPRLSQALSAVQGLLSSSPEQCLTLLKNLGLSVNQLEQSVASLANWLGLSPLEQDILLLVQANQACADAILPGSLSLAELSVHLAQAKPQSNALILGTSPLLSEQILEVSDEKLRLRPEIASFLLGAAESFPALSSVFSLWTQNSKPYAIWPAEQFQSFQALAATESFVITCYSNDSYQDLLEVQRVASNQKRPLMTLDLEALGSDTPTADTEALLKRVRNTVKTRNALLVILHSDRSSPAMIRFLLQVFAKISLVLLQSKPRQDLRSSFGSQAFELFTSCRAGSLWGEELKARKWKSASEQDAIRLESLFSLTLVQIDRVLNEIEMTGANYDFDTIASYCRKSGSQVLEQFAKRIDPKYSWDDLILPAKTKLKLAEIYQHLTNRSRLESLWNNRKRHNRGHGTTIVFEGDSGTGKTMAAEVLAHSLGLNLFQVDLSKLTSKYIGDTEKNLSLIFSAARESSGILLFDEGESLFSKRTEGGSSQDRYSNLEINHLLQELESFDGIVIISSNLAQNIDEAFLRRISFQVSFPKPDESTRAQIWKNHLSGGLPLDADVDFDFLSRLPVSGGVIRNVARMAASWAAIRGDRLCMKDILWSIRREFVKVGLSVEREVFGETYWKSVSPDWESVQAGKRQAELRPH